MYGVQTGEFVCGQWGFKALKYLFSPLEKWCLDKSVGQTENGLERGLTLAKLRLITGPKILEIPNLLHMSSRRIILN